MLVCSRLCPSWASALHARAAAKEAAALFSRAKLQHQSSLTSMVSIFMCDMPRTRAETGLLAPSANTQHCSTLSAQQVSAPLHAQLPRRFASLQSCPLVCGRARLALQGAQQRRHCAGTLQHACAAGRLRHPRQRARQARTQHHTAVRLDQDVWDLRRYLG